MYSNKLSKTENVLQYLLAGNTLTLKDCIKLFHCTSMAQRIQAIEEKGYKIKSTPIITRNKERIARYSMLPIKKNFKNMDELKRFVGLAENDLKCREDLEVELKDFYKKYTK